jgi:clathrin heavy chain
MSTVDVRLHFHEPRAAGGALQIFNMELQSKVKTHKMPDDQVPVYWNWISSNTIGIVTATACYHWSSAADDAPPAKVFDRAANVAGTQVRFRNPPVKLFAHCDGTNLVCLQIINYSASPDYKWLMVVGIKPGAAGGAAEGCMQLYSVEKKVSQALTAHAGCFHATSRLPGRSDTAILFCFVDQKPGEKPKLMIIEVGKDRTAPGGVFRLAPTELPVPADAAADFPVCMQASKKHDVVYILTKMGYAYVFDIPSGGVIFRQKVADVPVFASAVHEATGGVLAVTVRTGQVVLLTLNTDNLVNYISNVLRNQALAMSVAARLGLGGADELYVAEFNRLLGAGDIEGAAKCAANSPAGILRTEATISRFQSLPAPEGGQPPLLKYFATIMEAGKLNKPESVELARPAIAQGRVQLLEKWLTEDKITCSEKLGDMVMPINAALALQVYLKAGDAHEKVVQAFMATGDFAKIVPYCARVGYKPNFIFILQQLVHSQPKSAQDFATALVKNETGPLVEIPACIDVFMQFNRLPEATAFLVDVLAANKPEEGYLQTKVLEMNLLGGAPQVANAILGSGMFTHFDKPRVANLCEKYQQYQRALELYTDIKDIKRVMSIAAGALEPNFLVSYFGTMTGDKVIEVLGDMLKNPMAETIVVKVAQQYSEQLTPEELIKLFENAKAFNGLFHYLGAIVNTSENKTVHYKYIVAAVNLKQFKEVERVCRDSTVYDPLQVKEFLLDAKLPDPRPLIHVCDRYGFTEELTAYLYNNKLQKFVEVYVQKVAPGKTPQVVGKLLDLDADEDFIKSLLVSVGPLCPVQPLVEEVEKRNRLRLLQPFLETRVAEGTQDASVHNSIGKIYITLNKDPQTWLKTNTFYDSKVVGKFCEKLDPFLAYLAYKRANGACDAELIEVTSKNGLFKDLARYLVERQDLALWETVLNEANPHRRDLIDQVTSTALPETKNPDEVSTTVKAFMNAKLPNELIGLLEKLVLTGANEFAQNRNLQNLLILTAIRCANDEGAPAGRAMEYINRLDNFDGAEIAKIALRDEYGLFEEGFTIYKKFNLHLDAVNVLLSKIQDIDRAHEYAQRVNDKEVWSTLARAQLDANMIKDAIDSYIKAADHTNYENVIRASEREGKFEDLSRFLEMARKNAKERAIDSALAYALAQTHKLTELETFVTSPNVADIQQVGDRTFDEGLFEAARVLFASINNNAKLASTLVALGLYREAVDAAKKANSIRTWKEVNSACVRAGEFKLAQQCGLNIIVSPDHLEELISYYETDGHWEELIKLLEQGVGLETAHAGIFTELGVMYSKYRPEKLMEHIKVFWSRMNTSKMLRACENGRHWTEAVFLHTATNDYDQAVRTMIDHSPSAFKNDTFLEAIVQVRNKELHYQAITFYLEEEPAGLGRLLQVLTSQLDHARVVHQFKKQGEYMSLILPYLRTVQKENISAVNEAVNSLLVDEEDIEGLRQSIADHDNFDQVALAQRLEKHELLELRRTASSLYRRNKRWEHAINLSKQDAQYKDAIDAAAESKDQHLAEGLLQFFVTKNDKESFAATLFTCYSLIRADVAMELAWRARMTDFVMPFMIQYIRETNARITTLETRTKPKEDEHAAAVDAAVHGYGYGQPMLAIADTAYNGGYGAPAYGVPGVMPGYGAPYNPGYAMPPQY